MEYSIVVCYVRAIISRGGAATYRYDPTAVVPGVLLRVGGVAVLYVSMTVLTRPSSTAVHIL